MTAGNPCLLAIQEVEASLSLTVLMPHSRLLIAAYLAPAGMAADGYWIVGGGAKDTTDSGKMDEPFIAFAVI